MTRTTAPVSDELLFADTTFNRSVRGFAGAAATAWTVISCGVNGDPARESADGSAGSTAGAGSLENSMFAMSNTATDAAPTAAPAHLSFVNHHSRAIKLAKVKAWALT